ncbi:MAG: transglutaminase-like domain-containing protein [Polyangiaceae bacterium]
MSWSWLRTRVLAPLSMAVVVAITLRADAQAVVLHEFVPPDAKEDVSFAATTLDGDLPAAIQTPSGVATAPDPRKPPDAKPAYGGGTVDDGPDSTYEPDRDTRRPNVENYDDPFSPSTTPFKRLNAYDAVDVDYSLRVRDKTMRPVPRGGAVGAGDEPFYGDLTVDVVPDQPVRIPTVGPGSRLLRMHANPTMQVDFVRDQADNWFVRSNTRGRVRLVLELAIARATFGSDFADVDWSVLDKLVSPQPTAHQTSFTEVAQAIGVSRGMRPREAVARMVEYFRSFEASEESPRGRADIYLDLALSKKGVCRHRAFAFLVTALNLGIPARMVTNEAHAWVEVNDGALWHRIDLGGAALNLEQNDPAGRPPYVPPPDPYQWPAARDSAQDLADRTRAEQAGQQAAQSADDPNAPVDPNAAPSASPSAPATAPPTPNLDPSAQPADPERPSAEVSVTAVDGDIRRGLPLHLKGEILSAGAPCAHVRVDVVLVGAAGSGVSGPDGHSSVTVVGSLSTDARGVYDGAVVIPRDFALGEYELVAVTPGDARCAPSRSP